MDFFSIGFTEVEKQIMNDNRINYRKQLNDFLSEARKRAKGTKCYYCGKPVTSFCDSHYVPRFCLKNIAVDGKVYYCISFTDFELMDVDQGVKQAGTFNIICRECDSKIFQDYENPDSYPSVPSSKMLAEIAMKDYLKFIYKRRLEKAMGDITIEKNPPFGLYIKLKAEVQELDLIEYDKNFQKAKQLSQQDQNVGYELFFYQQLPYVSPVAMQSCIDLIADLDGQCVNNTFDISPDYHPRDLHLSILPLSDSTVIMMFVDSNEDVYKSFIKQFKEKTLDEQLGIINYIVFLYTEDYFISPSVPKEVFENASIEDSVAQLAEGLSIGDNREEAQERALKNALITFDLRKWRKVPNLLDEQYRVC
ncbi:MAG TPA: hypothetical protein PLN48_15300 [Lachnospiraceae bacterium]|nr:hypothetical protein [Lachnospiraceae bacterium]